MYYVYMLRCIDNSLYTGITTDINRRFNEHISKSKKCAKYTLNHSVIKIDGLWKTDSRVNASKLEYLIKKLSKKDKENLIEINNLEKLNIDIEKYERIYY